MHRVQYYEYPSTPNGIFVSHLYPLQFFSLRPPLRILIIGKCEGNHSVGPSFVDVHVLDSLAVFAECVRFKAIFLLQLYEELHKCGEAFLEVGLLVGQ